jgi:hypothetical protein
MQQKPDDRCGNERDACQEECPPISQQCFSVPHDHRQNRAELDGDLECFLHIGLGDMEDISR